VVSFNFPNGVSRTGGQATEVAATARVDDAVRVLHNKHLEGVTFAPMCRKTGQWVLVIATEATITHEITILDSLGVGRA